MHKLATDTSPLARMGISRPESANLPLEVRSARLRARRIGLPLVFAESRSIAHYALLRKTWANFQLDRERQEDKSGNSRPIDKGNYYLPVGLLSGRHI